MHFKYSQTLKSTLKQSVQNLFKKKLSIGVEQRISSPRSKSQEKCLAKLQHGFCSLPQNLTEIISSDFRRKQQTNLSHHQTKAPLTLPPNKSSTDTYESNKPVPSKRKKTRKFVPQRRKIYVIISFKNDTYVPKKRLECKQRAVAILRYAKTSTFHTEKSWGHLPQSRSGQARSI